MSAPTPRVPGFRDLAFLRHGRFGDLYTATRESDGRVVEVKLLRSDRVRIGETGRESEASKRFQREVQLLVDFEHPSLLRVLDHGVTESGDPWLALEHREGTLLSDVLVAGPLAIDRVRKIGAQIARVLSSAALHGIVHRGLAPAAILLAANDEVKVLDFGLAARTWLALGDEPDGSGVGALEITDAGQRVGDPEYMAPEAIDAGEPDERADRYALGILLFALLTGAPPFTGPAFGVLEAQVNTVPPPPSAKRHEVPAWLDALVGALLSKAPADRPDLPAVARGLVAGAWPPPDTLPHHHL